ncbi:hypothetical protein DFS33DRAFT_356317 [Desarmillaria ectypa]|nr:hypothetical protein DFS33DRAFT_356317 [Desarmillaria ectypa]
MTSPPELRATGASFDSTGIWDSRSGMSRSSLVYYPFSMHLALALFFIGLSLFLHPLRAALSWIVCSGTVLLIVSYTIVTILPIHFPQCPYRTPLCDLAYPPYIYIASLFQKQCNGLLQLLQHRRKKKVEPMDHITVKPSSLKQLELEAVEKASLRLSAEALHWLFSISSNPAVQGIVVETIGGLPMEALVEVDEVFCVSPSIVDVQVNLLLSPTGNNYTDNVLEVMTIPSGMERKFERLLRSVMFLFRVETLRWYTVVSDQMGLNELGATLVTQIPKIAILSEPWRSSVLLHNILCLETPAKFPPIVWANLSQKAADDWGPDLLDMND